MENAELIDNDDIKKISETLKSEGVTLVQRKPKATFIQGPVERANSLIKKILPGKRMNVFKLILSKINPSVSMTGCTKIVESAKQDFLERWNQLYKMSIRACRQIKKFNNNDDHSKVYCVYYTKIIFGIKNKILGCLGGWVGS